MNAQYTDLCEDTLIVWTDNNGVDMALSFQEAEGCGLVWYVILMPCLPRIANFRSDAIGAVQQRPLDDPGTWRLTETIRTFFC